MTTTSPSAGRPRVQRRNFTLIAYLTFRSRGQHKSEENRLHARETTLRLTRLLTHLRDHVPGVTSIRIYKHALGGLIPVERGHPATQVMVEVTNLGILDEIRARSTRPGDLQRLLEQVRERVETCATEVVYETPWDDR